MCGRFFIDLDYEALLERYGIGTPHIPLQYYQGDISPGREILYTDGSAMKQLMWGSETSFSKKRLINVRSETLFSKPFYRSFEPRIVYASGYYEWHQVTKAKTQIMTEEHFMAMAAIEMRLENEPFLLVLTKEATDNIRDIHTRMPVILKENQQLPWVEEKKLALDNHYNLLTNVMSDVQLSFL